MATPLSSSKMLDTLKAEGVSPKNTSNWTTHNRNSRGSWGPVNGIVIHHTAGSNSLNLCINGTSSLPGPLCHAHLAKNGTLTLISNGRANHAGSFAQNAHNAVVNESSTHPSPSSSEPVDGNRHYYGIEIENLGNGTDFYPSAQYDKAVRWAAGICRAHGWSANSIIGHKEGTTRKIDPKGPVGSKSGPSFSMNTFRQDVQERLNHAANWTPGNSTPNEEDDMALTTDDIKKIVTAVWKTDGVIPAATESQADGNTHATGAQWLTYIGAHVRRIEAKVEAQDVTIQALAQALADKVEVNPDELIARIEAALEGLTFKLVAE